jgi:RNA polymerase sigma-70 factor (ECF subfamily)
VAHWFATHVQPHQAMLRAWLHSRFGAQCDIDDLVQEACVRLLRAHEGGAVQSPKAFLFATARNLALDQVRHREVARIEPLVESEALRVLDEGDGVAETVAHNQELALLTEAIQSLPDRCRQIFTLRKVYGLSQREIAGKLGISERTVSAQLTIGVHKCTEYMRRHHDHFGSPR